MDYLSNSEFFQIIKGQKLDLYRFFIVEISGIKTIVGVLQNRSGKNHNVKYLVEKYAYHKGLDMTFWGGGNVCGTDEGDHCMDFQGSSFGLGAPTFEVWQEIALLYNNGILPKGVHQGYLTDNEICNKPLAIYVK